MTLRFVVEDRGVLPVVGGSSLLDLVTPFESRRRYSPAGGYGPLFGVRDPAAHYLPAAPAVRWLLGCDCGEPGCWPLAVTVSVADDRVTWSDFAQPFRPAWTYDGFGPFVFPRSEYESAVRDLEVALGTPPG